MHKRITPLPLLRALNRRPRPPPHCGCSCSPATSSRIVRSAHAAALDDSDPNANSGTARDPRPPRTATDYRFPERGRLGGPPDPYEVLGLGRGAGAGDIKTAYYALALVLHPDSAHPSASADHFATLNKAYKLLSTQSGRNSYLTTGYGWQGGSFDTGYAESSSDAAMRDVIRRARHAGAAQWNPRGFRDSDAGAGAWTYRNVDGRQWHPYDADGHARGGGEELYMTNTRFMALVAALAGVVVLVLVYRVADVTDNTREMLVDRHIHASKALEEARREAALFGKARRELIHRRVRENAVMGEIEKLERGEGSKHVPAIAAPAGAPAPAAVHETRAE